MRPFIVILLLVLTFSITQAQEKGVDQQNARIRDGGNNRQPAVNGRNTETGTGRGIDFGKGRTPTLPPVPNPYRFQVPNDVLTKAVEELMRERKLIIDDAASKPEKGLLVSQPYTFTKGSVVTSSELNRIADIPESDLHTWTRGRYTIIVEVLPIDSSNTNVSVNARIEGRSDDVLGAQWLSLRSNGSAEQDFLTALVEKVTGGPPPGREQP
ncbi:MAG TPA: hypothetical protein VE713_15160 [Pyrinomonadaceae bacterium]|jgi:hypothetical protein|nr:hypothetical protein [Pyrinomonadaceae bacterium]